MKVEKQKAKGGKKRSKANGVLERMKNTWDEVEADGININIYGASGTGKTRVWSSFPGKILAVICSGGKKPGELRSVLKANRKNIDPVVVHNSSEVTELIDYYRDSSKYGTIVLDHLTSFQDLLLMEVLDLDELPLQKSWGMARQQDYGQCVLQAKEFLRRMLDLDGNTVIIAQERDFGTDDDSDLIMPYVASAVTPGLVGWLNPACDYIVRTFIRQKEIEITKKIGKKTVTKKRKVDDIEYCLMTKPNGVHTVKFRESDDDMVRDVIVNPTYKEIMKYIN